MVIGSFYWRNLLLRMIVDTSYLIVAGTALEQWSLLELM